MSEAEDIITHLMGFGLTEKEAQCYFYLLKYGPKTPSPLAKSLHTYREDVHRTLQSLIGKGMVRPSLDSPTLYTAVELEDALECALKKHEAELQEMQQRKQELQELSKRQQFGPSDEVSTFKIVKTLGELITLTLSLVTSTEEGFIFVMPEGMAVIPSQFGITEESAKLLQEGKYIRGITDITYKTIKPVQELIDVGDDIRHYESYGGLYFAVVDNVISVSAINVDIKRVSLGEPVALLWTDDPTYAQYLTSTFELLWQHAVPAEERIRELLEHGPHNADQ